MRNIIIFISFLLASMTAHADWQQPELSHNLTPVKNVISASDFELPDMDEEKENNWRTELFNKKLAVFFNMII